MAGSDEWATLIHRQIREKGFAVTRVREVAAKPA
jgi:hypothetical protein